MSSVLLKTYHTQGPADLSQVVSDLRTFFAPRTLLLLEGAVGVGKTELTRALASSLGVDESASPSFAIHHRYENKLSGVTLDHVDLYRLEGEDDLESSGFWDLFANPQGLVVVEWSDRLNEDLLPLNWHKIKIKIQTTNIPNERILDVFVLA